MLKRSSDNKLDGGQVIVDYLIKEKVPYAFGLCGHGNIQFIDALYERQSDIKTISVHHRDHRRLHGGLLLPRLRQADRDLHLLRVPARSNCRSRSPPPISTRCRSWR